MRAQGIERADAWRPRGAEPSQAVLERMRQSRLQYEAAQLETEIRAVDRALDAARRNWITPGLIGYALVWSDVSVRKADGYTESFARHAFDDSLRSGAHVWCLINHDHSRPIGHTTDGSLRLVADSYGLRVELTPHDTAAGQLAMQAARTGRIRGVSVCRRRDRSVEQLAPPPRRHRTFTTAPLVEVSVVLAPERPSYARGWLAVWDEAGAQRAAREEIAACEAELDDLEELW